MTSQTVTESVWRARWGVIEAATVSEKSPWRHTIVSSETKQLSEQTILHELCHVKLNESGFLDVQNGFRLRLEQGRGNDYDKNAFRETLWCVAEAYAEWLCCIIFVEESKDKVEALVQAIGQNDALLNTYLNGGADGFAEILSTQTWLGWSNYQFSKPKEPWNDWTPMRRYAELQLLFAQLPLLTRSTSLDPILAPVKERIIEVSILIYGCLSQSS